MNIVIIEDEELVAQDLEINLRKLITGPVNITQLSSVKEGMTHFESGGVADLIFSDIQLGDGLSFEIFVSRSITAPVIFCTAYDAYALEAFKVNGIDYILKPFTRQTLASAMEKYTQLKKVLSKDHTPQYDALVKILNTQDHRAASILVYHHDKIIPINLDDIAVFYLENEVTHLLTFSGKIYYPNKNLDELERLSGSNFFRANRQYLVCRKTIIDVSSFFSRKLSLNLKITITEKVIISKAKAAQFLHWLANG